MGPPHAGQKWAWLCAGNSAPQEGQYFFSCPMDCFGGDGSWTAEGVSKMTVGDCVGA